ncbi:glycosyltransferase family 2 protein [Anaerosinus sp.]
MNKNIENLILNLLDTCIEAGEYLYSNCLKCSSDELIFLGNSMISAISKTKEFLHDMKEIDSPKMENIFLYCDNIEYSIRKIQKEGDNRAAILQLEILPLFYELKEILDLYYNVIRHSENWEKYRIKRENKFRAAIPCLDIDETEYEYEVSIVVRAYNNLAYTKKAIESIFKYTNFKKLNAELITINNGSNDGTEEYFNSLPHTKKINLKYNILGNNIQRYNVQGKYAVSFSNDVIATSNWLENLLTCIKSDSKIIAVVPTCNHDGISNGQGIIVPYKNSFEDINKIDEFAKEYNKQSRPELWEERSLLMPFILMSRVKFFHATDGIDALYLQHEFVDDDLSTSLRRAGLKQILAKDTFMHHFGSVTLGDGQRKHNSFNNMREVYYKKWGVDAWDSRCYLPGVERLLESSLPKQNPKLLFIEPRFGGGSLQIKNCLKKHGILPEQTVSMVVDQRYIEDAVHMYDETIRGNDIYQMLDKEERLFDIISIGCLLHDLITKDVIEFLENLYKRLTMHGKIIFLIKNYRSAKVIVDLLQNNMPGDCGYKNIGFTGIHSGRLIEMLEKHKFLNQCTVERIGKHTPEVDAILNMDSAFHTLPDSQKKVISDEFGTEMYMIMIEKVLS